MFSGINLNLSSNNVIANVDCKLRLSSFEGVERLDKRQNCPKCDKKRKYFCYDCRIYMPEVEQLSPKVELPVKVDVIKHIGELNSKSTAIHAVLVAPEYVRIFDSFDNVPFYRSLTDNVTNKERIVVVYPSKESSSIASFVRENGPIQRFIFLDSTWNTVGRLKSLKQLKCLPFVRLEKYETKYWRPQKGFPQYYLATIEAIYFACLENYEATERLRLQNHKSNQSDSTPIANVTYDGRLDDLLFWFHFFRSKVSSDRLP